jgi:hypothetical protein
MCVCPGSGIGSHSRQGLAVDVLVLLIVAIITAIIYIINIAYVQIKM